MGSSVPEPVVVAPGCCLDCCLLSYGLSGGGVRMELLGTLPVSGQPTLARLSLLLLGCLSIISLALLLALGCVLVLSWTLRPGFLVSSYSCGLSF